MLKIAFLSTLLSASVCVVGATNAAAAAEKNYSVVDTLQKERAIREKTAEHEFYNSPRESSLVLSIAPAYFFGMHSSVSGGDGYGMSAAMLLHANSDNPDLKLHLGGEMLSFHASATNNGCEATVDTANLLITVGASCDIGQHFSFGMLLGYGLIGATTLEEKQAGDSDKSATMNSVFSAKPYAELMFNKNLSIYAGYRFIYMAPSIISTLANWGDIEVASHSVEIGIRYRF